MHAVKNGIDTGGLVMRGLHEWAGLFQYLIPLLCVVGAIGSIIKRGLRKGLVSHVVNSQDSKSLNDMTWQEFESLIGEVFRLKGYSVAETGGGGPDGGIDLKLQKDGETFFVQCKQWRAYTVGIAIVRELYGVMAAQGATGGFVVTSGTFSDEAKDFAENRNIILLDGENIYASIHDTGAKPAIKIALSAQQSHVPDCPVCGRPMVKRVTKRGPQAGREFWGCIQFPSCRGMRPMDSVKVDK